MGTVTVSPKFQVVIPREIREEIDLKAGARMQVVLYEGRIELIPVRPMKAMRGFLRGMPSGLPREKDRL